MMEMSPELIQTLVEVGGGPVAVILAFKLFFNGTGEKVKDIENAVTAGFDKVDQRLAKLATTVTDTRERVVRLEEREKMQGEKISGLGDEVDRISQSD